MENRIHTRFKSCVQSDCFSLVNSRDIIKVKCIPTGWIVNTPANKCIFIGHISRELRENQFFVIFNCLTANFFIPRCCASCAVLTVGWKIVPCIVTSTILHPKFIGSEVRCSVIQLIHRKSGSFKDNFIVFHLEILDFLSQTIVINMPQTKLSVCLLSVTDCRIGNFHLNRLSALRLKLFTALICNRNIISKQIIVCVFLTGLHVDLCIDRHQSVQFDEFSVGFTGLCSNCLIFKSICVNFNRFLHIRQFFCQTLPNILWNIRQYKYYYQNHSYKSANFAFCIVSCHHSCTHLHIGFCFKLRICILHVIILQHFFRKLTSVPQANEIGEQGG